MTEITTYFNSVYDATFRDLMRYCIIKAPQIADADDLVQIAYTKFYRTLCRRGVRAIRNPNAYLMTLLKRELAGYYRLRASKKEVSLEVVGDEPDSTNSVEYLGLEHLTADEVWAQVRSEPETTQRMFILFYGYEMRIREIADALGTTEASVKNRLLRVRNKLKETYERRTEL